MFCKKYEAPRKVLIAIVATLLAVSLLVLGGCWSHWRFRTGGPDPHPALPHPLAPGVDPFSLPEAERQALINRYHLDPDTFSIFPPPDLSFEQIDMLPSFAAVSADGERTVFEQSINWYELLQPEGFDFGVSRIQAAFFNATFGSRVRMIFEAENTIIVFPEHNVLLSFNDLVDFFGEEIAHLQPKQFITADIAFIEDPPAELFTTQGMNRMPMAQVMQLLEGIDLLC
ncbi:MAG: hypothetical protein FWD06_00250 [Oscillospiraceae bacterium]|nr:hypothetical protein [Oscillospiraceae bacterium]